MIGLFVILGAAVPVLLSFSLIYVRDPRWMGWALWAASLGIMAYVWLWVLGLIPDVSPSDFGVLPALWFSWAPFVALFLKRRGVKGQ